MAKAATSMAASCADYDSAEDEEVADTRKQANVAAKRTPSHSSGLGKEKPGVAVEKASTDRPPTPSSRSTQHDLASDSGYSTRTQATSVSADSGTSASKTKPTPPTARSDADSGASGPTKRRSTVDADARKAQRQPAPTSTTNSSVSRSSSQKSGSGKGKVARQCTDLNCPECLRGRKLKAAASPQKAAAKASVEPTAAAKPLSRRESTSRPLPDASQPSAPPRLRQRAYTSAPRPRSMYDHPSGAIVIPGGGPPLPYNNRAGIPYGVTPPTPGYVAPAGGQTMYTERPALPRLTTDNATVSARRPRPSSIMSSPLVTYDANAGTHLSARRMVNRTQYFDDDDEETEESYDEDEDEEEDDNDDEDYIEDYHPRAKPAHALRQMLKEKQAAERRLLEAQAQAKAKAKAQKMAAMVRKEDDRRKMPPPAVPASSQQYSMRNPSKPAYITYGSRNEADFDDQRENVRATGASGSSVQRRLSVTSSGERTRASNQYHPTSGSGARITVEHPTRNRRLSHYAGESRPQFQHQQQQVDEYNAAMEAAQILRTNRASADLSQMINEVVNDRLRDLSLDHNSNSKEDAKVQAALAYQHRLERNSGKEENELQVPLTATALRRRDNVASETGSSRSKRSSNDAGTRISAGQRLAAVVSEHGGLNVGGDAVKMRFNPANGFEAEFEGRRLYLNPTGDGNTMELVIGSRNETVYHSTRGSVTPGSVKNGNGRSRRANPDRARAREIEDDRRSRTRSTRSSRSRQRGAEPSRERNRSDREEYDGESTRRAQARNSRPPLPRQSDVRYPVMPADDYPHSATAYPGYPGQAYVGFVPPPLPPGYSSGSSSDLYAP